MAPTLDELRARYSKAAQQSRAEPAPPSNTSQDKTSNTSNKDVAPRLQQAGKYLECGEVRWYVRLEAEYRDPDGSQHNKYYEVIVSRSTQAIDKRWFVWIHFGADRKTPHLAQRSGTWQRKGELYSGDAAHQMAAQLLAAKMESRKTYKKVSSEFQLDKPFGD